MICFRFGGGGGGGGDSRCFIKKNSPNVMLYESVPIQIRCRYEYSGESAQFGWNRARMHYDWQNNIRTCCTKVKELITNLFRIPGGGGGGVGTLIFSHNPRGGGTLIFAHIRRHGLFIWVQNSEFKYFLGF